MNVKMSDKRNGFFRKQVEKKENIEKICSSVIFWQNVRECLLYNRVKFSRLATDAGVSYQRMIGAVNEGEYNLTISYVLHIACAIGCSVEDLFFGHISRDIKYQGNHVRTEDIKNIIRHLWDRIKEECHKQNIPLYVICHNVKKSPSAVYTARTRSNATPVKTQVEILCRIANELHYSIDTLIGWNYFVQDAERERMSL